MKPRFTRTVATAAGALAATSALAFPAPVSASADARPWAHVANGWKTEEVRQQARYVQKWTGRAEKIGGLVAGASGGAAAIPGPHSPALGLVAIGATSFTLTVSAGNLVAEWIAEDPPDPEWMSIVKPKPIKSYRFRRGGSLSGKQVAVVNDMLQRAAEIRSYGDAFITSYERELGVDFDKPNAMDWYTRQFEAADKYGEKLADAFDALPKLRDRMRAAFRDDAFVVTRERFKAAQRYIRKNGLPKRLRDLFDDIGLKEKAVRRVRNIFLGRPPKLPVSFPGILSLDRLEKGEKVLARSLHRFGGYGPTDPVDPVEPFDPVDPFDPDGDDPGTEPTEPSDPGYEDPAEATIELSSCPTGELTTPVNGDWPYQVAGNLLPAVAGSELQITHVGPDEDVVHNVITDGAGSFTDSFTPPLTNFGYYGGYQVEFMGDDERYPAYAECSFEVTGIVPPVEY